MSETDDSYVAKKQRDELIFELIKMRYSEEGNRMTNLDNKALGLIGALSFVVGLMLGVGTFKITQIVLFFSFSILYFGGILSLIATIALAIISFRIRVRIALNLQVLIDKYTTRPSLEVLQTTSVEIAKSVESLERQNSSKEKLILLAGILMVIGLVMVFVFVAIFTYYVLYKA